ncbi:MFS transporter, partial [Novosphingobium aerophilum]
PIFLAMFAFVFEPEVPVSHPAAEDGLHDRSPFPVRQIALIGGVTLLCSIIYYVYAVNGGLAFREVGVESSDELGRITFLPSLGVSLGAAIFWLIGKRRSEVAFALLLALVGGGLWLIGVAPDWKWMAAGVVFQQTGVGMMIPTLITWAQRDLPVQHRGRGMGVWTGCFFLGQFLSPPLVTVGQTAIGSMQGTFAAAGMAALVGVPIALRSLLLSGSSPRSDVVAG